MTIPTDPSDSRRPVPDTTSAPRTPVRRSARLLLALVVSTVALLGIATAIVLWPRADVADAAHEVAAVSGDRKDGDGDTVELTGNEPVTFDGTVVETPCFTYVVPPDGRQWELGTDAKGCATSVLFGSDLFSQFFVRGQTASGTAEELGAGYEPNAGERVDVVTVGGREAFRILQPYEPGLDVAMYLIPVKPGSARYQEQAIGSVFVAGFTGPEHDGIVTAIVGSLEVVG